MNKVNIIWTAAAAIIAWSCSTGEPEIPENMQGGLTGIKHSIAEMEVSTKGTTVPQIYAFAPDEIAQGIVSGIIPTMIKGNVHYYNLPSSLTSAVFSNLTHEGETRVAAENGNLSVIVENAENSAFTNTEVLLGKADNIVPGSQTIQDVELKRLSSFISAKIEVTDFEGKPLKDNSITGAEVTYTGFGDKIIIDSELSPVFSGSASGNQIFEAGEDGIFKTSGNHFIPAEGTVSCDVKISFNNESEKVFNVSLPKTFSANRSYTVTFKFKKANGTGTFTISEPNVQEETFLASFHEIEPFYNVFDYCIINKEAGSKAKIYVNSEMPSWDYELTEGSEFFSLDRNKDTLIVTALQENIDGAHNGSVKLSCATGKSKNIYITQLNASKQVITLTKSNTSNTMLNIYGTGIEFIDGNKITPVVNNTVDMSSVMQGEKVSFIGDCIYSLSYNESANLSFSNCVNLISLRISPDTNSELDLSELTSLKDVHIRYSNLTGIKFSEEQKIEKFKLFNCIKIAKLDVSTLKSSLKTIICNDCLNLKDITMYPDNYTGEKILEYIDLSGSYNMFGLGLANYTKLKTVIANDCQSMSSINLIGCTALKSLSLSSNKASLINLSNCSALEELSLSYVNIDKIINTGCDALKRIEVKSSVTVKDFDFSGRPELKNLILKEGNLNCTKFNVSGCQSLESIYTGENNYYISCSDVNVSDCPSLKNLSVRIDWNTTDPLLEFSGCTSLNTIILENFNKDLDYSILPSLKRLCLKSSRVSNLNLSECYSLEWLEYDSGDRESLTSISLPANLEYLRLTGYNSSLTGILDLKHISSLKSVYTCFFTALSGVDLSGCQSLYDFTIHDYSGMETLNLDRCTSLEEVRFYENHSLTTVSFADCTNLKTINEDAWSNNKSLKTVNLAGCNSLGECYLTGGMITALDFSTCSQVYKIDCSNNAMEADAINAMFTGLPDRINNIATGKIKISGNPGEANCNLEILYPKNWYVQ